MGNSSRDKLNTIWFWIALFVALIVGSTFNSFSALVITFGITFGILMYNGNVRYTPGDRIGNGRRRRP